MFFVPIPPATPSVSDMLAFLHPFMELLFDASESDPWKKLHPIVSCRDDRRTGSPKHFPPRDPTKQVTVKANGTRYELLSVFQNKRYQRIVAFRECANESQRRIILCFRPTMSASQMLDFTKVVCDAYPLKTLRVPGYNVPVPGRVHPFLATLCREYMASRAFEVVMRAIRENFGGDVSYPIVLVGFSMGASCATVFAAALSTLLATRLGNEEHRIVPIVSGGFPAGDAGFVAYLARNSSLQFFSGRHVHDRIPLMFDHRYAVTPSLVYPFDAEGPNPLVWEVESSERYPVPNCTFLNRLKFLHYLKVFLTDHHVPWPDYGPRLSKADRRAHTQAADAAMSEYLFNWFIFGPPSTSPSPSPPSSPSYTSPSPSPPTFPSPPTSSSPLSLTESVMSSATSQNSSPSDASDIPLPSSLPSFLPSPPTSPKHPLRPLHPWHPPHVPTHVLSFGKKKRNRALHTQARKSMLHHLLFGK